MGGGVPFGTLSPQVSLRYEEVTTLPVLSMTQELHSRGSRGVPERSSCLPLQGKQACKALLSKLCAEKPLNRQCGQLLGNP